MSLPEIGSVEYETDPQTGETKVYRVCENFQATDQHGKLHWVTKRQLTDTWPAPETTAATPKDGR